MTSQTINAKLRILAPDDGMAITDGHTYTTGTIYLAWNADASAWREIPESEIPQRDDREPPPPPPRTFDKYRLVDALITAGVWDHVEAWLKETPYAWLRVQMAPDISEDEQLLKDGIGEMKKLLGWTDEQVEAVLAASVKEGY